MGKYRLQVVALVAAFLLTAASAYGDAPPPACTGDGEAAVACLVNAARAAMGLRRLRPHPALATAAERYARRMRDESFFAHADPDGAGPADRVATSAYARRRAWAAGETLGRGSGVYGSPQAVVFSWLASPSHRRIILGRRWRHVGVGIADTAPTLLSPLRARTFVLYAAYRRTR